MKKNLAIFTIIIFSLLGSMLLVNNSFERKKLTTDSGFDGGYDGGGSSGGSWSSSSSSSGSSSSFSKLSEEGQIFSLVMLSVSGLIVSIVIIYILNKNQEEKMSKAEIQGLIKDKNIDEAKLIKYAYDIYYKVQIAWMNDTLNDVKDIISDELYNQYDAQLSTLRIKKQQNIMRDIKFIDGYIYNIDDYGDYYTVAIVLVVHCRDYIINKETKEVLRGSSSRINKYNYSLSFSMVFTVI